MDKQKKWQSFLILAVIALTLYNILPTLFYYCKPLKNPMNRRVREEIRSLRSKKGSTFSNRNRERLARFFLRSIPPEAPIDRSRWPKFHRLLYKVRRRRPIPQIPSARRFTHPLRPRPTRPSPQEEELKEVVVHKTHSDPSRSKFLFFCRKRFSPLSRMDRRPRRSNRPLSGFGIDIRSGQSDFE